VQASKSVKNTGITVHLLGRPPDAKITKAAVLNGNLRMLRSILEEASLDCSYSSLVRDEVMDCSFYAKASVGTYNEKWFETLYGLIYNPYDDGKFDTGCQCIISQLLSFYECVVTTSGSSPRTSFWYNVMVYTRSTSFVSDRALFPMGMQDHTACIILLQMLVVVFKQWIVKAGNEFFHKKREDSAKTPIPVAVCSDDDENRDINGFLGWAVKEVLCDFRDLAIMSNSDEDDTTARDYIERMKIRHWEAIINEEYFRSCYSPSDAMRNRGGLTLVSPIYFSFGRNMMAAVRNVTNQETISEKKNACMVAAENALMAHTELLAQFLACDTSSGLSDEVRTKIYVKILKKVLHARAGVEFRRYSEDNTSRYAAKGSTVAFRTGLDVGSKSTSVANSIMLESKK